MKPENYKLALRRARKAAKKILEAYGNVVFEAIDRRGHPVLISVCKTCGIVCITYICLENEKIQDVFDKSIPPNILQEAWVKQYLKNDFKVILPKDVHCGQTS